MTSDGTRDGVASPPSTAVASNAVGPDTPRSDDIVDTTELRWFARGPASPDVLRWFGEIGPPSVYEERSDLYRIYGLADVSVKRRFGELFELKVRRSVDGYLGLPGGPGGQPEHWHKWSPADELVGAHRDSQWVAVDKVIANTPSAAAEPPQLQEAAKSTTVRRCCQAAPRRKAYASSGGRLSSPRWP